MIEWNPVSGSSRIQGEAYDSETERIYVRFTDGVEWWYAGCPPHIWVEFTSPGNSRGQYISRILNYKQNGRHAG